MDLADPDTPAVKSEPASPVQNCSKEEQTAVVCSDGDVSLSPVKEDDLGPSDNTISDTAFDLPIEEDLMRPTSDKILRQQSGAIKNTNSHRSSRPLFTKKPKTKISPLPNAEEKVFDCSECDYKCSRKRDLQKHAFTHTGERPYACHVCGYVCAQSSTLRRHVLTHTDAKRFSCEDCSYKCLRKHDLRMHKLTHTKIKPIACQECDYRCSHKYTLMKHMLVHTRGEVYSCDQCSYTGTREHRLEMHKLTHKNSDRRLACGVCDFKCSFNSGLRKHMLLHTGEKPFACEECGYICALSSQLQKHVQIHVREKEAC